MTNNMLLLHPFARLEYWFFKVNSGPVALLVDWIARRQTHEHWLRVSIHSPQKREVLFDKHISQITGEQNFLSAERTVGQLGSVAWDLVIEPGFEWIAPDIFPATLLRMTDLSLVSAPLVTFSGWVHHEGQSYKVQRASGMVSHYWGRQLSPDWWWISANQFDRPEIAVECTVLRSCLWGSPITLPLAYLYLRHAGKQELVMAPFGRARVKGSPPNFEIQNQRLHSDPINLVGLGRDYSDLGDGIINTLVGDLEIWKAGKLIARAEGTAGIERRAPQNTPDGPGKEPGR